ncbi:hypothetical protein K443DRAFT_681710, partial [Laccaria amethystina LaAM-08-1]
MVDTYPGVQEIRPMIKVLVMVLIVCGPVNPPVRTSGQARVNVQRDRDICLGSAYRKY